VVWKICGDAELTLLPLPRYHCLPLRDTRTATASIELCVFAGDHPGGVTEGDILKIESAYCTLYQRSLQLYVSKRGRLTRSGTFCMAYSEVPNMSELRFDVPNPSNTGSPLHVGDARRPTESERERSPHTNRDRDRDRDRPPPATTRDAAPSPAGRSQPTRGNHRTITFMCSGRTPAAYITNFSIQSSGVDHPCSAVHLGHPTPITISKVTRRSTAEHAGLRPGMVIVEIAGVAPDTGFESNQLHNWVHTTSQRIARARNGQLTMTVCIPPFH
jgi:hypothetical protein